MAIDKGDNTKNTATMYAYTTDDLELANCYNSSTPFDMDTMENAASLFYTSDDRDKLGKLESKKLLDPYILSDVISPLGDLNIDLIITDVSFGLREFSKLDMHLGDSFSVHYFGQNPIVLNVQGTLFHNSANKAKYALLKYYEELGRISKVARLKVAPFLFFNGGLFQGGMLNLSISQTSEQQDILKITFNMLVLSGSFNNSGNTGEYGIISTKVG